MPHNNYLFKYDQSVLHIPKVHHLGPNTQGMSSGHIVEGHYLVTVGLGPGWRRGGQGRCHQRSRERRDSDQPQHQGGRVQDRDQYGPGGGLQHQDPRRRIYPGGVVQDTEVGSHRIIEEDKDDEDVYSIGVGEVH